MQAIVQQGGQVVQHVEKAIICKVSLSDPIALDSTLTETSPGPNDFAATQLLTKPVYSEESQ